MSKTTIKWNELTATCYLRHMICKGCPNQTYCIKGEGERLRKKIYGLRNVKEVVIKTYTEIGKKGLERFVELW